jgi:hypothetical protein
MRFAAAFLASRQVTAISGLSGPSQVAIAERLEVVIVAR